MAKLFIVVNVDWFFLSHRKDIALSAQKEGYDVTILTKNTGYRDEIENFGFRFINLSFERARVNFFKELAIYRKLVAIYKKEQPDLVHHVTLKPIILGNLAAKKNPEIAVVNAVSGLGITFSRNGSKIKRLLTLQLLKKAFHIKNPIRVIFQNKEDRDIFLDHKLISIDKSLLIKGSGIDLNAFHYYPPSKKNVIKVLIAARMLYLKGFDEFSQAAAIITKSAEYQNVKFEMAGDLDLLNSSGIPKSVISIWEKERNVKWLGHVSDMKSKIARADIIVFPSFYGEGIPKFLIEACSIGRPIITTDHPGCRDCVIEGDNGFLVPVKNVDILAKRIIQLVRDPSLREKMGLSSRKLAEREFSIISVVDKTLALYHELLY